MKKQLFKALAATAIVGAVMAMSSVVASAADNLSSKDTSTLTGVSAPTISADLKGTAVAVDGGVKYTYSIADETSTSQKFYGLTIGGITLNSDSDKGKFNNKDNSFITFTTDGKFDITVTPPAGKNNSQLTLVKGSAKSNEEKDIINSSAANGAGVTKEKCDDGTWTLGRYNSKAYAGTIEITVYKPEPKYTVSGNIKGDYTGAKISIKDVVVAESGATSYSTQLSNGTYDVTVDSPLYEVSPKTITVNNGAVTQDITVTKAAVTTLTITAPAELGLTGSTIDVKDADGAVVKATKTDAGYEAIVAQGGTYSIDVLADKGYQESAYVVGGDYDNIEVGSATSKTVTLTAEKITEWNIADVGKTMPEVTIEKVEGTYKGIAVNANKTFEADKTRNGKFASKSGQLNSKTTLTIPLDTDTQELELTVKDDDNIGYTLTYGDGNAVITAGDPNPSNKYSIYIQGIKIVDKKTISEGATPVEGKDGFSYAIDKAGNATYVIYGINEGDLVNDKLTLTVGTGETAGKAETTEVYTAVQFAEGDTITAGEGAYSDYAALYAVKVTGVQAAATKDNVSASLE